mgnify:FL=1
MTAARVALLRGVNVGGATTLPMADLRRIAGDLGWRDVRTYIASGNLVFASEGSASACASALAEAIRSETGLDLLVLVETRAAKRSVIETCPFDPEVDRHVHVFFLADTPKPDQEKLKKLRAESEAFEVKGRHAWLHAPQGVGRSKLAARIEDVLGCRATARNLATVRKIAGLLA